MDLSFGFFFASFLYLFQCFPVFYLPAIRWTDLTILLQSSLYFSYSLLAMPPHLFTIYTRYDDTTGWTAHALTE
ncbi:hypothetical protein BDQ12DRAFT_676436 [Crucibulum laeve]|uniref:Uncharacterized protein n=1 Tax=Crucibulum laeve TaxID=68775 RepID=A0A5C3MD33_9AGAR|nr:hypothetical protein BDQ12DRAFT_676436 [Crucibulum laeve]